MATKKFVLVFAVLLSLSLFPFALFAGENSEFSFDYDDAQNPVCTQVFKWKGSRYASKYKFILRDSRNKVLKDVDLTETRIELTLPQGNYTFRVATFNVLGKIEAVTDWQNVTIRKANIPRPMALEPSVIYIDEWDPAPITLTGANFEPTAQLFQGLLSTLRPVNILSQTQNKIEFEINPRELLTGNTKIRVVNDGNIYAEIPLPVRNRKLVDFLIAFNYTPFYTMGSMRDTLVDGKNDPAAYRQKYGTDFEGFGNGIMLPMSPMGLSLDMVLFCYKAKNGHFGIGVSAGYNSYNIYDETDLGTIVLTAHSADLQFMFYYKYPFVRIGGWYFRAGPGATLQWFDFDYGIEGISSESLGVNLVVPNLKFGTGFQFFLVKGLSFMFGVDARFDFLPTAKVYPDASALGKQGWELYVMPSVGLGYQF